MSFENESLRINSAVKDNNFIVELPDGSAAKFKYFIPGNDTTTEDGVWDAIIEDEAEGTFYYDVPEDVLTPGEWRTQPFVIVGGRTYHGNPDCFEIDEIGLPCSD